MRLLNSTTLKLHEFIGSQIPPYAILSHTWGEEEVSFQELQGGNAVEKKGFEKIKRCCEIATEDGFEYAWVDTCCIDKTSSAELSEAINSMYRWYQKAEVCYAFLSDVPSDEDPDKEGSAFRKSRWFTRGWTLQELIAPLHVQFLGRDWKDIGSKLSLQNVISEITKIRTAALLGEQRLANFSVAQKMSWASNRVTTREEDIAYCLMGIFDINMSMLYGEGTKAFIRLQEQIITNSEDDSIFAWCGRAIDGDREIEDEGQGLLALSPEPFVDSGNILRTKVAHCASKVSFIGGCIRWEAPVLRSSEVRSTTSLLIGCLVFLSCSSWNLGPMLPLAIRLQMSKSGSMKFERIESHMIHTIPSSELRGLEMNTIFLQKVSGRPFKNSLLQPAFLDRSRVFHFRCTGLQRQIVSLEAYPVGKLHSGKPPTGLFPDYPTLGIRLKDTNGVVFDVMLSFRPPSEGKFLTAFIAEPGVNETLEDVFSSFVRNNDGINLENVDRIREGPLREWPTTTFDRICWHHSSGAQSSVTVKKIGRQREPTWPAGIWGPKIERVFMRKDGIVTERLAGDVDAHPIESRFLIDVKLE